MKIIRASGIDFSFTTKRLSSCIVIARNNKNIFSLIELSSNIFVPKRTYQQFISVTAAEINFSSAHYFLVIHWDILI